MKCPVCQVAMIVVEKSNIELDYCIQCRGIWFDEGELELFAEKMQITTIMPTTQSSSKEEYAEKLYPCPRCGKKMHKIAYGSATNLIDKCPQNDGIWFDEGELSNAVNGVNQNTSNEEKQLISFLGETFKI